jgi:hypothetical protein
MPANSNTNPKPIFEPESVEELLRGWQLHAHKGRQRHDEAARRCDRIRRWLGATATIFSAVVGTTIFAALEKQLASGSSIYSSGLKAAIIAIAVLSAILTGLSTFLNLAERTEKHRWAGVHYKKMIRELERILSQSAAELTREDPSVIRIQQQLDELEESAPVVPEELYHQIEEDWKEHGVEMVGTAQKLYRSGGAPVLRP